MLRQCTDYSIIVEQWYNKKDYKDTPWRSEKGKNYEYFINEKKSSKERIHRIIRLIRLQDIPRFKRYKLYDLLIMKRIF